MNRKLEIYRVFLIFSPGLSSTIAIVYNSVKNISFILMKVLYIGYQSWACSAMSRILWYPDNAIGRITRHETLFPFLSVIHNIKTSSITWQNNIRNQLTQHTCHTFKKIKVVSNARDLEKKDYNKQCFWRKYWINHFL